MSERNGTNIANDTPSELDVLLAEKAYPSLFNRLDRALPEFDWQRHGDAWQAQRWPTDFPCVVQDERPDRLMVYPDRPWWIKVHGHAGVRFLDYVNGGRRPTGADFFDAVRKVCDLAGVPCSVGTETPAQAEASRRREQRQAALEDLAVYCAEVLWSDRGEKARAYLRDDRGLTDDDMQALGLGLYLSAAEVRKFLEGRGHSAEALDSASAVWPKFEGYITIPWADERGRPLTIYGRWQEKAPPPMKDVPAWRREWGQRHAAWEKRRAQDDACEWQEPSVPKTNALPGKNTKASPFCLDRARRHGHRELVLVEGVFDAAFLQVRGETRAVAAVAAQLSGEQLKTLTRCRIERVYVCGDPDGGGDRGTLANVTALTEAGIPAYVVERLPDGLDPDEFIRRDGIDAWRERVAQSAQSFRYRARLILQKHRPEGGWSDATRDAALHEARAFALPLPDDKADELQRHFWPEIRAELGSGAGRVGADAPDAAKFAELVEMAEADASAAIDAALDPERLAALARLASAAPGDVERFYRMLTKGGAKAREVASLRQAVNQERKRLKREKAEAAYATAAGLSEAPLDPDDPARPFANYLEEQLVTEDGKPAVIRIGRPVQDLAEQLLERTGGWPKCVDGILFAEGADHKPLLLEDTHDLFAWIGRQLPCGGVNALRWASGADKVPRETLHAYLVQTVERFDTIEMFPHWPPLPGCYYMHRPLPHADGGAYREFLGFFQPATDADYDLIDACARTAFWGGQAGARPGFLFTAEENDRTRGRGVGKTKAAQWIGELCGGAVMITAGDRFTADKLVTRLLSPEAMGKRVVLLDNLKALRFSDAEIEGLITTKVISGHRMFHGEGRRPNTLLFFVTVNGASLSRDMAERCVPVRLKRPKHDGSWEERLAAFIEEHRWAIIADIIAGLKNAHETFRRNTRWGQWENAVLAGVAEPAEAQKVITERQGEIDDDDDEGALVRQAFYAELEGRCHRPDREAIFIPSAIAAGIVNLATGERRHPTRAIRHLLNLPIEEIRKSKKDGARGVAWRGKDAPPDAALEVLHSYTKVWPSEQAVV